MVIFEPEEGAGQGSLIKDAGICKKTLFIRINGDNLLNTGNQILYPIFEISGLFHDSEYISHVTAAKPTPVAYIWHFLDSGNNMCLERIDIRVSISHLFLTYSRYTS